MNMSMNTQHWHTIFLSVFSDSYSKLPKKTVTLEAYKKRKALADAIREIEQEQAQVNVRQWKTLKQNSYTPSKRNGTWQSIGIPTLLRFIHRQL